MNRRLFLESAMIAASALAVDPERLLWTPGKKTIFIPPPQRIRTLRVRIKVLPLKFNEETEGRCDVFWHEGYNSFFRIEAYEA